MSERDDAQVKADVDRLGVRAIEVLTALWTQPDDAHVAAILNPAEVSEDGMTLMVPRDRMMEDLSMILMANLVSRVLTLAGDEGISARDALQRVALGVALMDTRDADGDGGGR